MGIGSESGSGSLPDFSVSVFVVVVGGRVARGAWFSGEDACIDWRSSTAEATDQVHDRWDHARDVTRSLSGEKFSKDQAARDPDHYFHIRMNSFPAAEMVDRSKVLYFGQAFWRSPQKPFRQRFYMVKPCPKEVEMRC